MRGENSTWVCGVALVLTEKAPHVALAHTAESILTRRVSFSGGLSGSEGTSARSPAVIVSRLVTAHWSCAYRLYTFTWKSAGMSAAFRLLAYATAYPFARPAARLSVLRNLYTPYEA